MTGVNDDADRELRLRRADLEREFEGKQRDLKAQHKRQMDHLEQDRLEWESYKKSQAKEIADKAERLHRRVDNVQKTHDTKAAAQEDLADLKTRLQEAEKAKLKATSINEDLVNRAARAQRQVGPSKTLLTVSTIFSVAVGAAWLWTAWMFGDPVAAPLVVLVVAGALLVMRLRLH